MAGGAAMPSARMRPEPAAAIQRRARHGFDGMVISRRIGESDSDMRAIARGEP
jgi:hypothetical protein